MKNIRIITVSLFVLIGVLLCMAALAADKAPDKPIILKGAPMGGVKFEHSKHSGADFKCETCHHAAKPEKAPKAATEACSDCHTTPATAPMKTKRQAAFHNPSATAGLCMDCHKKQAAAGKKTPAKCMDCHQKANI